MRTAERRRRRRRRRGEGARAWLGRPGSPQPPTQAALPPRQHRPHRSRNPLRARGRGSAWKERESKSKASCTLKFSQLRPLRRQASSRSARPLRAGEWQRGRKKGTGRGPGRREREREGEGRVPQHLLKLGGGGARAGGGGGRGEEGRRELEGGARRAEGQLFRRVSSAGCAGPGRGAPSPARVSWTGMGPSSRKSIGCQERHTAGAFFLSLFPPSRGLTKSELSLRACESEGIGLHDP